jgi:hypothetical protein
LPVFAIFWRSFVGEFEIDMLQGFAKTEISI